MTSTLPSTSPRDGKAPSAEISIRIEKEYLKFSSAHFLIFEDGTAEKLHGHNYRVAVELTARRARHGMVIDFCKVKPLIKQVVGRLDERFIIPGAHPVLTCEPFAPGELIIRFGGRRYIVPADEVVALPVDNTSSENLAGWIATELTQLLTSHHPQVDLASLSVSVEETPGQQGTATLRF